MIVRQAPAPAPGMPAGYVLSGRALWDDPVVGGGRDGDGRADFVALTTLVADQTNRKTEAAALLRDGGGDERVTPGVDRNALSSRAETSPGLRAIAAGDVNGDGLDDLLLADSGFIVFPPPLGGAVSSAPNVGRAYVVLGRTAVGSVSVGTGTSTVTDGFLS